MHAKPLNSNKSMYILFIVGMCFILSFLNSFYPLSIQCTWSAELMYSYKIVTQSNLHFSLIDYASSVKLRRLTNDSLSLSLSLCKQNCVIHKSISCSRTQWSGIIILSTVPYFIINYVCIVLIVCFSHEQSSSSWQLFVSTCGDKVHWWACFGRFILTISVANTISLPVI